MQLHWRPCRLIRLVGGHRTAAAEWTPTSVSVELLASARFKWLSLGPYRTLSLLQGEPPSRPRGTQFGPARRLYHRRRARLLFGRHVREALANGTPVVALESTVITHGFPEPQNLALAMELEAEIRDGRWRFPAETSAEEALEDCMARGRVTSGSAGKSNSRTRNPYEMAPSGIEDDVVPATIGIVKGQLVVGLSGDEIEYLASRERSAPIKASRRDIPIAMARGLSAGTTVSATMAIAAACGRFLADAEGSASAGRLAAPMIRVFATGGMGGVHVGGESSMDISADLFEFANSPIGVVSSGFKSFLDTRRSLEFLETMGCTVASLAGSRDLYVAGGLDGSNDGASSSHHEHHQRNQLFPGFFSTISKELVKSPWQCQSVREAAEILLNCLGPTGQGQVSCLDLGRRQVAKESVFGPPRAMLLANPIPSAYGLGQKEDEEYRRAMEGISSIDKRLDLAGHEKTPLILAQLNRLTGGRSLGANMILLRNNARVGAHLALECAQLAGRAGGWLES